MLTQAPVDSVRADPSVRRDLRLPALRRFAIAITVLNTLGHTVLGFETSLAQVFVAAGTAYVVEIVLELIAAWAERRTPAFVGRPAATVDFFLPAHITGLAISMLLYAGDRLLPFAFASAIAITSKTVLVAPIGNRFRHFMNPSNVGLVATIFLFPSVAIAPGYHFSEYITGGLDWALPGLVICTGTFLNWRFTRKMPLILSWLAAFVVQATIRHLLFDTWLLASLAPLTGVAYVLFTYYMISDPGTTPSSTRGQIIFGASVGILYGVLIALHVVFAIFLSLFFVCAVRGLVLHALALPWIVSARTAVPGLSATARESGRPIGV